MLIGESAGRGAHGVWKCDLPKCSIWVMRMVALGVLKVKWRSSKDQVKKTWWVSEIEWVLV